MPTARRSLALTLLLASCAVGRAQEPEEPLAPLARLVGGEWRMTRDSQAIQFDTWTWGPGRRSIVNTTHGWAGEDVPWRVLDVCYWHPGRREVRMLGLHQDIPSIGRGVMEGTLTFVDTSFRARVDLEQQNRPRKPRTLAGRWDFEGPGRYRETLSEAEGPEAPFAELAAWDYVHDASLTPEGPLPPAALEVSANLRALAPLVGGTWSAGGDVPARSATLDWLPLVEVVRLRLPSATSAEPLLEAYLFHHPTRDVLRCLALSADGGVHEGELETPEDGSLRLRLTRHDDDGSATYDVLLEPGADGAWHARVGRIESEQRTAILDTRFARGAPR